MTGMCCLKGAFKICCNVQCTDMSLLLVLCCRSGDTVHLVKGASKTPNPPPSAQVPESISTGGQIAGNPLAPLMNATNAPYIGNFNPFADMGMNPNDPNSESIQPRTRSYT